MNVLGATGEKSGAEETVWNSGGRGVVILQVQKG